MRKCGETPLPCSTPPFSRGTASTPLVYADMQKINFLAKKFKTPLYCYSYKKIKNNIKIFKKTFKSINPIICFAVKANPNRKILNEIGVALTPGTDFDKKFGLRTLRLAFSSDNQKVIEAVTKLKKWFEQNY